MIKLASNIINTIASIILSLVIANYGIEEFYTFLQKEVTKKVQIGLPSLSKMTNKLSCKQFNDKMELTPYKKGYCKNKGNRNVKR